MSFDRTMSILQPCVFVLNFTSKLHYAVNKMLVKVMVSDVQRIFTSWPRQCTNFFRASVAREDKRIELNCEMLLLLLIVHQTRNLQMMWICSCLVERPPNPEQLELQCMVQPSPTLRLLQKMWNLMWMFFLSG
jgi:hypothetical protein